uniref:F-box associated domain-containing protein n=1 Tax=Oryza punctata TaxID=4537 RepID=A0A0E0KJP5_ORYPU
MDVSKLFYPSTAEALEAEAIAKKKKNGANKIGSMGSLPTPSIHYQPFTLSAPKPCSSICALALFGESRNKILCSDMAGHTSIYNTELRSFMTMPELNFRKGPNSVAVSIPGASAHAMSNFDNDMDHSLYIMDNHANWCCFEVLAYDPVEECWCWRLLPEPPFFQDREYEAPLKPCFTVVDNTKICVSTTTATYSFDTVTREWNKVVLPFKPEYVPELGLCLGISDGGPYDLCTLDNLSTATGSSPPVVRHVGMEFELPENWSRIKRALVNLGSLRFCIVNGYTIENEQDECDFNPVAVFTGVEVLPNSERGLRMIKHKSKCFNDFINFVL